MKSQSVFTAASTALLAISAIVTATPPDEPPPRREGTAGAAVLRTAPGVVRPDTGALRKVQGLGGTMIVYRPPAEGIGAPGGRVGGGRRTGAASAARVEILGPAHPGRTSKAQPVIYWYLSDSTNNAVDLFLSSADDSEALLDISLDPPVAAGVHRVSLADHGVRLTVGKSYKFHVFLRSSGNGPARTVAIAVLDRVAEPSGWSASTAADPFQLVEAFASHGLWYDALDAVSVSVERGGDPRRARELRAQLLEQVGLAYVAEEIRR